MSDTFSSKIYMCVCVNSSNPHNTSVKKAPFFFPFHIFGNWGTEQLSNFPNEGQVVPGIWTQIIVFKCRHHAIKIIVQYI